MANTNSPIVIAQSLAGGDFGGAENFYTRMVCALAACDDLQQHALTRASASRVNQLSAAGVPVQTFKFGGRLNLLDHYRYRKALKALSPDIVMTYMSRASGLTPKGDYKLVCRLGSYYNLKYYQHADYWVGISKGICNHLIQGGMPAERVVQIPNFADESIVEPIARSSFDTPTGVPILLAAGRLHQVKAFDVLLQSLAAIPDAILWLAGDGPEKQSLLKQCDELGITQRVRFLGWRNDVAALMRTADLFVCSSRHEGLGSIVMESWFNHCPIVATQSQGPGELIDDGFTGLLTPVDEAPALADAIKQLINAPEQREKLVDNAFQHYQQNFSRKKITSDYQEFFHSLVTG